MPDPCLSGPSAAASTAKLIQHHTLQASQGLTAWPLTAPASEAWEAAWQQKHDPCSNTVQDHATLHSLLGST